MLERLLESRIFSNDWLKSWQPSKDNQTYVNEQGTEKEWFDQNIFNWCLKNREFAQVKLGHEVNACKSVNVTNKMVSSLIISSNEPPVVLDQTKCIHPLMGAPFSSFSNKLAIAKTLGFDLVDVAPDRTVPEDFQFRAYLFRPPFLWIRVVPLVRTTNHKT